MTDYFLQRKRYERSLKTLSAASKYATPRFAMNPSPCVRCDTNAHCEDRIIRGFAVESQRGGVIPFVLAPSGETIATKPFCQSSGSARDSRG